MRSFLWVLAGFVSGATVAGLVTLLLVPRSGKALRGRIQARFEDAVEQGQRAAEARQRELGNRFEAMKQPQGR